MWLPARYPSASERKKKIMRLTPATSDRRYNSVRVSTVVQHQQRRLMSPGRRRFLSNLYPHQFDELGICFPSFRWYMTAKRERERHGEGAKVKGVRRACWQEVVRRELIEKVINYLHIFFTVHRDKCVVKSSETDLYLLLPGAARRN